MGVASSLAAFAAGFEAARGGPAAIAAPADLPAVGPRLAPLAQRIEAEFPAAVHGTLRLGILRLADYQDIAYAGDYLDRLAALRHCGPELLDETARHLALWMSYEDTIRVADLKTRRSRFDRVAGEVKLTPAQQLDISEFMHPRIEEVADTLPAALGRWLLATGWARACVEPFTRRGRIVKTSSLRGYLLLYLLACLRRWRRKSLRFEVEHGRIGEWLAAIGRLARQRSGAGPRTGAPAAARQGLRGHPRPGLGSLPAAGGRAAGAAGEAGRRPVAARPGPGGARGRRRARAGETVGVCAN